MTSTSDYSCSLQQTNQKTRNKQIKTQIYPNLKHSETKRAILLSKDEYYLSYNDIKR